jgi:t-SNARE complex subunit (syntaxin)
MSIKKKLQENSEKIEKRLEEFETIGNEQMAKVADKIDEFLRKKKISKVQGFIIVFIMALVFFTLTGDMFKINSWYPLRISWVNPMTSIQKTINTINKEAKK